MKTQSLSLYFRVDLAKECQRLIDGFKKNISTSETVRTLLEMKTMLKTPDWQKSSIWMVIIYAITFVKHKENMSVQ